jgi:hypothetical protein
VRGAGEDSRPAHWTLVTTTPQTPDVFLAYSRSDDHVAKPLIEALRWRGISVWWDVNDIPIGANWGTFLTDQLERVRCVVVLWSRRAVTRQWVLFEAEQALRRNVLLPVVIEDGVEIPQPFMNIQAASLVNWTAGTSDGEFGRLIRGIERLIKEAPDPVQTVRSHKESQRVAERRARELFLRNVRSEIVVDHIEVRGTPFYKDLEWNVGARVNVLLGRNGYGKTYLLRGILALLQYNDDTARQALGAGSGSIVLVRDGEDETIEFANEFFDEERAVGLVPILAIPDTRFINRSVTTLSAPISDETTERDRADLAAFGAWHFLHERPYEGMIQTFLYGLCLDYFEAGGSFDSDPFVLIRDVVRELTDHSFEFDRVAREGRDRFTLYVRTEGNETNPLPVQKASQGTLSVIAMVGLIYDYLKALRKEQEPDIRQRAGIVLIDEIDAHLHPVWQQKIVSILRERFPRVQFLLTAHNPIVVAGCLEDEVSVLRKGQDGFSLLQFPNDFIGWQTEDIYKKVFDIESPDATFTRYDAMRPFKQQLQQDADRLSQNPTRSVDEEQSLQTLETQLLYIEKVEQTRNERLTREELERENRMLRDRVSATDTVREDAVGARRTAEESRKAAWVMDEELRRAMTTTKRLRALSAFLVALLFLSLVTIASLFLRR